MDTCTPSHQNVPVALCESRACYNSPLLFLCPCSHHTMQCLKPWLPVLGGGTGVVVLATQRGNWVVASPYNTRETAWGGGFLRMIARGKGVVVLATPEGTPVVVLAIQCMDTGPWGGPYDIDTSSVRGMPLLILSTLLLGCQSSPSSNLQPNCGGTTTVQ